MNIKSVTAAVTVLLLTLLFSSSAFAQNSKVLEGNWEANQLTVSDYKNDSLQRVINLKAGVDNMVLPGVIRELGLYGNAFVVYMKDNERKGESISISSTEIVLRNGDKSLTLTYKLLNNNQTLELAYELTFMKDGAAVKRKCSGTYTKRQW